MFLVYVHYVCDYCCQYCHRLQVQILLFAVSILNINLVTVGVHFKKVFLYVQPVLIKIWIVNIVFFSLSLLC